MPTDKCVVCEQPLTYKAKYPFHTKCFKGLSAPRRAELARRAALTLTDLEKIEGKKQAARTSIAVDVETKKRAAPPPAPAPARPKGAAKPAPGFDPKKRRCVVCKKALPLSRLDPYHWACYAKQSPAKKRELEALSESKKAEIELVRAAWEQEEKKPKKKAAKKKRRDYTEPYKPAPAKKRAAPPPAPPSAPRAAPRNISILHDAIDQVDQLREVEVLEQLIRQRKRELKRPPRYLIYREHELVNCGKSGCLKCGGQIPAHGPYWYVYLQDREAGGKLYKTYVGKNPDAWKDKLSKRGIEPFEDETVRFEGHNARYGDL